MNPIRKGVVIGVILLFIGLAFAPSINANMGKDELVEFTREVCGLNGGKQTVKLTQQQADEVEGLFNSIREKLNATESREEAEDIFKDGVVELDKYGLLGGLSVKQAQRLVTGGNWYPKLNFDSFFPQSENKLKNMFCLVAGKGASLFDGIPGRILYLIVSLHFKTSLPYIFRILPYLYSFLFHLIALCDLIRPIKLRYNICYGGYSNLDQQYLPSHADIVTVGLLGKQSGTGTWYGSLGRRTEFAGSFLFTGIQSFKGLSFLLPRHGLYYFGHALLVGLQRGAP